MKRADLHRTQSNTNTARSRRAGVRTIRPLRPSCEELSAAAPIRAGTIQRLLWLVEVRREVLCTLASELIFPLLRLSELLVIAPKFGTIELL